MRFLLDTDICIYRIKQKPRPVLDRFRQLPVPGVGAPATTAGMTEARSAARPGPGTATTAVRGLRDSTARHLRRVRRIRPRA